MIYPNTRLSKSSMSLVEPEKKQSGDSLSIESSMSENGIMNISHCLNFGFNTEIGFVSVK